MTRFLSFWPLGTQALLASNPHFPGSRAPAFAGTIGNGVHSSKGIAAQIAVPFLQVRVS